MSVLVAVQIGCLIAFGLLLLAAAWEDWRIMRIADATSLMVVVSFIVWALAGLGDDTFTLLELGLAVLCAAGVFGAGALAFAVGALGGGDVKLAAAASLFAGPALLIDFVMVTTMAGGVLGVAIMAGAPIGPLPSADGTTIRARLRRSLPYGPAIAVGGLWVALSRAMT
jgi:prepilin peptidase CpaA